MHIGLDMCMHIGLDMYIYRAHAKLRLLLSQLVCLGDLSTSAKHLDEHLTCSAVEMVNHAIMLNDCMPSIDAAADLHALPCYLNQCVDCIMRHGSVLPVQQCGSPE